MRVRTTYQRRGVRTGQRRQRLWRQWGLRLEDEDQRKSLMLYNIRSVRAGLRRLSSRCHSKILPETRHCLSQTRRCSIEWKEWDEVMQT